MIQDTQTLVQKFIAWTKLKLRIHIADEANLVYFHEREIWRCSLGVNIGYEQNGKNEYFERPILVLKKFNKHLLLALPLTSQEKSGKFYYRVEYLGKDYYIILSQLRAVSSKRLLRKIRTLPEGDFEAVRKNIKNFL